MILKTQINVRVNSDMNISQSYERMVDGDEEVETAGLEDGRTFYLYLGALVRGYTEASE